MIYKQSHISKFGGASVDLHTCFNGAWSAFCNRYRRCSKQRRRPPLQTAAFSLPFPPLLPLPTPPISYSTADKLVPLWSQRRSSTSHFTLALAFQVYFVYLPLSSPPSVLTFLPPSFSISCSLPILLLTLPQSSTCCALLRSTFPSSLLLLTTSCYLSIFPPHSSYSTFPYLFHVCSSPSPHSDHLQYG